MISMFVGRGISVSSSLSAEQSLSVFDIVFWDLFVRGLIHETRKLFFSFRLTGYRIIFFRKLNLSEILASCGEFFIRGYFFHVPFIALCEELCSFRFQPFGCEELCSFRFQPFG
jgi:hypothetical protein